MILDHMNQFARYESLHPLFPAAGRFLRDTDLSGLPDGRHEIQGRALYAIVMRAAGKKPAAAPLETHDEYIDIQIVLGGTDTMGWKARSDCATVSVPHDRERDIQFFADPPESWVAVGPGRFAVFFPADAHAPMVADAMLHKVVIKVRAQGDCAPTA